MERLSLLLNKVGVDLVYVPRFKDKVSNARFIDRVLTIKERLIFNEITNEQRKLLFLAGRFACKEAYAKAVKKGIGIIDFQDFEVLYDESGAPKANISNVDVSISHDEDYVIAMVLVGDNDE